MKCSRCRAPRDVDLTIVRHVATTCIHDLATRLICEKCKRGGYKPIATLDQLTRTPRASTGLGMCNLYSIAKNQDAIRRLFAVTRDLTGSLPPMPGVFPDYPAPIVRQAGAERQLSLARWGMPSSQKALMDAATKRADKMRAKGKEVDFKELPRLEPDSGTTNIRNTSSGRWKRWLGPDKRCLVPFSSMCEKPLTVPHFFDKATTIKTRQGDERAAQQVLSACVRVGRTDGTVLR